MIEQNTNTNTSVLLNVGNIFQTGFIKGLSSAKMSDPEEEQESNE